MIRQFDSLMQLMETFADEQTAIDHFTAIRWRGGAFCPYCGGTRIYHFSDKRTHKCGDCRQRFSIKVGTIFEDQQDSAPEMVRCNLADHVAQEGHRQRAARA